MCKAFGIIFYFYDNRFLGLLAENGRLNKLNAVFNSFESIMQAHREELYVEVTSAEVYFLKRLQETFFFNF